MKKIAKKTFALALVGLLILWGGVALATIAMTGCGHTHKWKWVRTETEHYKVCAECNEELEDSRSAHSDGNEYVCDTCAEFKALALGFTEGGDSAHADFANEANVWFPEQGKRYGFTYEFSTDFGLVNSETLANYDVVMFLNNRPSSEQMPAFKDFMDNGGGCLIFHAAGFAMWDGDPFTAPDEWEDWYQNDFLRCGVYGYRPRVGLDTEQGAYYWNTWNPTAEPMKVETHDHPATANLGDEFMSAPCEWYEWEKDLFEDEDATVLLTMNPTPENPAGDDNRPDQAHQIWIDGHHPIAWANNNYNMVYMNWGHNLQSYNLDTGSTTDHSETFSSPEQCQFTLDALFGVAGIDTAYYVEDDADLES